MSDQLVQFAGRLHPLLLHLPIGVFFAIVMLEMIGWMFKRPIDRIVRGTLAWLFAGSAVFAAGSGWLLGSEPSYGGNTLDWHRWLGVAVAVLAVVTAMLAVSISTKRGYVVGLLLTGLVLMPAGHLGASMTHGENFIFEPFGIDITGRRSAPRSTDADAGSSTTPGASGPAAPAPSHFASAIAPILETRCVSCHGPSKKKGGLAIHTKEAILAGGDGGPAIVPGDPAASELLARMLLPMDHDDHMPPPDKPQATPEEIKLIEEWIASGASFDTPARSGPVGIGRTPPSDGAVARHQTRATKPAGLTPVPALDSRATEGLEALHVHVEVIEPESGLIWVDASAARTFDDQAVRTLLAPIAHAVAELSLSGTAITDHALETVASMTALRKLDLSRTSVTAAGLRHLSSLANLRSVNLSQTVLGEGAGPALATLPMLAHLTVWRSDLSATEAEGLQTARPDLMIETGQAIAASPLETEPPLKLIDVKQAAATTTPAPSPSPSPTVEGSEASGAAALKPVNTLCPVSGKPVDARYIIVHRGQAIGMCCEHCATQFWANPDKYPVK